MPKVIRKLAKDPELLGTIQRHIAMVGLVGEEDGGLLTYIAYSSRILNDPLSIIIKGPSGSGKDEVQRKPALLMPPGDVIEATSLTANALYYGPPSWLEHKILLGGERSHSDEPTQRDKTAALRQMLSQKYITKQTVDNLKTERIRQDGPISYSETTTRDSIFKEDSNRCFQINTDASPELTRKVMGAVAEQYMDTLPAEEIDPAEIIERHREFQQSLEYVDVRIPYACKLSELMPADKVEVRRIIKQVLAVIEAIAFLHQHQHPRDKDGRLLATLHNYQVARRLLLEPLHATIGVGKKFSRCGQVIKKLPPRAFNSTEVLGQFKKSKMARDRALKELQELGVLKCTFKGKSHKPSRWKWTGTDLGELVLPSIETLRNYVTSDQKGVVT